MLTNGIATVQDFRNAIEIDCFGEPERVVLPKSGLAVTLRRPRAIFFALLGGRLPKRLAAVTELKAEAGEPSPNVEEIQQLAGFWAEVFTKVFVQPRLSLTPGMDEIDPNWLLPEDCEFLFKWVTGEVAANGRDLAPFRRNRRTAGCGTGSRDLGNPPEPTTQGDGDGLADRLGRRRTLVALARGNRTRNARR